MAKTTTAHNKARSPNKSAEYIVCRNGKLMIVIKSFDKKQEA
jgi:hypothetical protein